jgi:biopolymer transport protein ExbD
MAGSASGNETEISGINITPLVDIMLVLVIILMVTAEFTKYRTVPVALPKVNAAAVKKEPQKIALTVQLNGDVIWNDRKIDDINKLPAMLRTAKKIQPELAVILRAEGGIEYRRLLDILDEVKMAGIAKVGLAVDSSKKENKRR